MLKSYYNSEKPLTLGILGGGQLAKMLAQEAYRLGINVAIIEKEADSPAGDMTKLEFSKGWLDDDELTRFVDASDIITLENEFIDSEILERINKTKKVFPSPETMKLIQDKLIQKQTFQNAGIPVPIFKELNSSEEAVEFGKQNGFPIVIKARKYGYDGYGNATAFNDDECFKAWERFNNQSLVRPLFVEAFVNFSKEIAVMVARNENLENVVYPCVETIQYRHICHAVIAPAEIDLSLRKTAQELALKSVEAINGIGVFGVEMFLTNENQILINEIAPRPHNSGHYTIEACFTSQFENTIRAVCNLPLGSPDMITPAAAMVNLLGKRNGIGIPDDVTELLRHKKVWVHLYNKKKSRIGRKMGHITALGTNQPEAMNRAQSAADAIVW